MFKALTIAGSDSGGGAGIQADLKTFAALGVYGLSAITAITAQNTVGVTAVHEVPADVIGRQIDAVVGDIGVDAAKTGMLSSSTIIGVVVAKLREHHVEKVVVDPVMVAKSGDRLLQAEAVEALRTELLPLAYVVTPNLPEAAVLCGWPVEDLDAMREAARAIHRLGPRFVLVKGGHLPGDAVDLLFDGTSLREYRAPRIETIHTHGTGCTYSSAIAAGLARGLNVFEAIAAAKHYLTEAIRQAVAIGQGRSPVHHFHQFWA